MLSSEEVLKALDNLRIIALGNETEDIVNEYTETIRQALQSQMWQPISIAPKDGTEIRAKLYWTNVQGIKTISETLVYWNGHCWQCNLTDLDECVITHWMPIP